MRSVLGGDEMHTGLSPSRRAPGWLLPTRWSLTLRSRGAGYSAALWPRQPEKETPQMRTPCGTPTSAISAPRRYVPIRVICSSRPDNRRSTDQTPVSWCSRPWAATRSVSVAAGLVRLLNKA